MRKRVAVAALTAALIAVPYQNRARPTNPDFTAIEGCVAIGIIGIMGAAVITVWCYNYTHPDPTNSPPIDPPIVHPPPDDPGTNAPPVTNNPPHVVVQAAGDFPAVDVSGMGWQDTNATAVRDLVMFTNALPAVLWAGDKPDQLHPLYNITAWLSSAGRMVQYSDTNGLPLWTGYAPWGQTPSCPLPVGTGAEPARFYQLRPQ